jgi:hypothetical protein
MGLGALPWLSDALADQRPLGVLGIEGREIHLSSHHFQKF